MAACIANRLGESAYGRTLMRSPIDLAADAIVSALDEARPINEQLDGLIVSFGSPIGADANTLAQVLGLNLPGVQANLGARTLHRKPHPVGRDGRYCGVGLGRKWTASVSSPIRSQVELRQ